MGLQLLLRPANGESAALFEDELYERSARWKLSTSGLSAGHLFKGTGFGTVYEDGYGINCESFNAVVASGSQCSCAVETDLAAPEMIKFGIESKFSSPSTSTEQFKQAVVESLMEMKLLCLESEDVENRVSSRL